MCWLKDSSNDRSYEIELAEKFPDLAIFPGSEANLAFAKARGLAGCISGSVSLWTKLAAEVWQGKNEAALVERRAVLDGLPFIAAVRYLTARNEREASWERGFPPLEELSDPAKALLASREESKKHGPNS